MGEQPVNPDPANESGWQGGWAAFRGAASRGAAVCCAAFRETPLRGGASRVAGLLVRTLLFVGLPLALGLSLLDTLEENALAERTRARCSDMREVLARVGRLGIPSTRFLARLDRLAAVPLPPRVLAGRAARLVRSERGALDLYVFDADGFLVPLPGRPPPPKAASQAFLKGLLGRKPAPHPKLVAAFAGNPEAVSLLGASPGLFVDLQNGDRRSSGGWWPVRNRRGTPVAWIVAFLHRSHIDPDRLMDRAVGEVRRLVGRDYWLGWRHPARPSSIRPPLPDTPAGLADALESAAPGVETLPFAGRHLVTRCSRQGDLLFCLARNPPPPDPTYAHARRLLRAGSVVVALLLVLAGPTGLSRRLGIRGKLLLLLVSTGGIILGGLLTTVLGDRATRERQLVRQFEAEHVALLEKIDRASATEKFHFAREYGEFARVTKGMTIPELRRQVPRLEAFVARNRSTFVSVVLVSRDGQVLYQIKSGKNTAFQAQLAKEVLFRMNDDPSIQEPQGDAALLTDVLAVNLFWAYRRKGMLARQRYLEQDVLFAIQPIEAEDGSFQALLLAVHGSRILEERALERLFRRIRRGGESRFRWAALPISPDAQWKPFPRASTGGNPVLRRLRDQVVATQLPAHGTDSIHGREYLLSAMRGMGLEGYVLLLARPFGEVRDLTRRLNLQVGILTIVLLLLCLGGATLAARLLLSPLRELTSGLSALAERRFKHRISPCGTVELARVIERFNLILEDLGDLQIARNVQEHLWPAEGLTGPGWSITGRCRTAAGLGGDHHEWFSLPDGRVVLAIGDVAGHGVPAALVTAAAKVELALNAARTTSPGDILTGINAGFLEQAGRSRPMTLWLGIFDPAARNVLYSDAGHLFGLVLPPAGEPGQAGAVGFPLGARKVTNYRDHTLDLSAGGRLILYSDGLVEAGNPRGQPFGYDRFQASALARRGENPEALIEGIFQDVAGWSGRDMPDDDQTLVVLAVSPPEDQP